MDSDIIKYEILKIVKKQQARGRSNRITQIPTKFGTFDTIKEAKDVLKNLKDNNVENFQGMEPWKFSVFLYRKIESDILSCSRMSLVDVDIVVFLEL